MKITDRLIQAQKPVFSFEIIPPNRGRGIKVITDIVEQLKKFNPPFVDVTSHCSEAVYEEQQGGDIKKRISKKRPGTIGICGVLQNRFNLDTVTHLLCRGFTREETEDALIELNYLGIQNILALRGDGSNYQKTVDRNRSMNNYAVDLVKQIVDLRAGKYIENLANSEPMDFCVGVAGYPEKHFEAPNLAEDIAYLKQKVSAGADYIVTQMFFDNRHYHNFVESCRASGITVPIIPGIKIINNERQLASLPKLFNIEIPSALVEKIRRAPQDAHQIGIEWGRAQVKDLLDRGAPCVHFFIMNDAASVMEILEGM